MPHQLPAGLHLSHSVHHHGRPQKIHQYRGQSFHLPARENFFLCEHKTRHITVTLCRSGDWARFIVEDDGQGIAPDRLEHLFDGTLQGQQGDRGRSMGIGLSVCRTVVRAHGGHIRGENRQEGGARFTVELPLDKEIQQEVDSYEDQG